MTAVYAPTALDGSGATDVTASLNAFLKRVPDGPDPLHPQEVILTPGAVHRVDGILELTTRKNLRLVGDGVTLIREALSPYKDMPVLRITGGQGITVEALEIDGGHEGGGMGDDAYDPDLEGQHGIAVFGTLDLAIDHCKVHHTRADALYFTKLKIGPLSGGQASYRWCKNTVVRGGEFHHTGRSGVSVLGAECTLFCDGVEWWEIRRSTINTEVNSAGFGGVRGLWVINAQVGSGRLNFMSSSGTGQVDDVHVLNSAFTRPIDVLISNGSPTHGTGRRTSYEFAHLISTAECGNDSRAAINAYRVDGLKVHHVTQPMGLRDAGKEMALVGAHGCTGVDVGPGIDLGSNPTAGPLLQWPR